MAKKSILTITLFIIVFILVFSQGVFALTIESENYSVSRLDTGIQASNLNSNDLTGSAILLANAGGEAQNSLYQGIIGFFGKFKSSTSVSYNVTINQTAIVQAGNVYSVTIEIKNLSSNSATVSSPPKITLYDPLKNLIVSNIEATKISDKKYQYNFTTSPTHIAGEWQTNITLGINGVTKQYTNNWKIAYGNTEIIINSINVASSPTINADITITNEGNTVYEYQYKYCIVSDLTKQCGEADNIDYASGAKSLTANQSWNPTLSLNVAKSGTYWFKVIANYTTTQQSGASKSFSVSYTPTSSIGGTGGGGSSTSNQPTTIDVQESTIVSKQQVVNGVIAQLETNEKVIINFQPSNAISAETHTITMSNIGTNSIILVISSNPINLKLLIGEEKEVDIDGDGKKDIYFKLNKINNGKADLLIKQIVGSSLITGETIKYPEYLLDTTTEIINEYLFVHPGSTVMAKITMYNFGTEEIKDATLTYYVKNSKGEVILKEEETIAIYLKSQLIKQFIVPINSPVGVYIFHTDVLYNGGKTVSEAEFEVTKNEGLVGFKVPSSFLYVLLIIFGFIIVIFILWKILPVIICNKEKFAGISGITKKIKNKLIKHPSNSVSGLAGKKVYSDSGDYIGNVEEVLLEKNRIHGLEINVDAKYKFKAKGIIVDYKYVKSVGEVIIVHEKVFERLENYKDSGKI